MKNVQKGFSMGRIWLLAGLMALAVIGTAEHASAQFSIDGYYGLVCNPDGTWTMQWIQRDRFDRRLLKVHREPREVGKPGEGGAGVPSPYEPFSGPGWTGAGMTVGIVDSGVDYTHGRAGGDDQQPENLDELLTGIGEQIAGGYDYVGDGWKMPLGEAIQNDVFGDVGVGFGTKQAALKFPPQYRLKNLDVDGDGRADELRFPPFLRTQNQVDDTLTKTGDTGKKKQDHEPFERGFGTTIGNSLRRTLLSSIEGVGMSSVNVGGVVHEFSELNGVEGYVDFLRTLPQLEFVMIDENGWPPLPPLPDNSGGLVGLARDSGVSDETKKRLEEAIKKLRALQKKKQAGKLTPVPLELNGGDPDSVENPNELDIDGTRKRRPAEYGKQLAEELGLEFVPSW